MRRLSVVAATVLLVLSAVPLANALPAAANRHAVGNFVGSIDSLGIQSMFLFEVHTAPNGDLQFGYYQSGGVSEGPDWWPPYRDQGTVETVRFFTDESGSQAAEFTGEACAFSTPDTAGSCGWYRVIVTDGTPLNEADTFCAGITEAAEPGAPDYCPFIYEVVGGDIRIYG